jgi:hypothetical protein
MGRRVALIVVVVLAATLVASGPVAARPDRPWRAPPLPALECGTLPAGDVRLTDDLTCTEPFTTESPWGGGRIPWDDAAWDQLITIDLGGHTLDISAIRVACLTNYWTPDRCGILGPYRFVNGTIIGNLGSVAQLERVVVMGLVYLGSTHGPYAIYEDTHITRSTIVDGLIRLGFNATIQGNVLLRTTIDQHAHQVTMRDLRILDNLVVASPTHGIQVMPTEVGNDMAGIVARNLVIGSHGAGILLWSSEPYLGPMEVRDNIVWGNDGHGIDVRLWRFRPDGPAFGGPLTIGGNLAVGNTGQGIAVDQVTPDPSIVVDAGGNRAVANAVEPACSVVTCP